MRSNAAKEWSGKFHELEKKRAKLKRQIKYYLKEHKKHDKETPKQMNVDNRQAKTLSLDVIRADV
jgi:hypothetical protein